MVEAIIETSFQAVAGFRHALIGGWEVDDTTIVRGMVTYTRHDGSMLAVPFANVMKRSGDRIGVYLI